MDARDKRELLLTFLRGASMGACASFWAIRRETAEDIIREGAAFAVQHMTVPDADEAEMTEAPCKH